MDDLDSLRKSGWLVKRIGIVGDGRYYLGEYPWRSRTGGTASVDPVVGS